MPEPDARLLGGRRASSTRPGCASATPSAGPGDREAGSGPRGRRARPAPRARLARPGSDASASTHRPTAAGARDERAAGAGSRPGRPARRVRGSTGRSRRRGGAAVAAGRGAGPVPARGRPLQAPDTRTVPRAGQHEGAERGVELPPQPVERPASADSGATPSTRPTAGPGRPWRTPSSSSSRSRAVELLGGPTRPASASSAGGRPAPGCAGAAEGGVPVGGRPVAGRPLALRRTAGHRPVRAQHTKTLVAGDREQPRAGERRGRRGSARRAPARP